MHSGWEGAKSQHLSFVKATCFFLQVSLGPDFPSAATTAPRPPQAPAAGPARHTPPGASAVLPGVTMQAAARLDHAHKAGVAAPPAVVPEAPSCVTPSHLDRGKQLVGGQGRTVLSCWLPSLGAAPT